MRFENNNPQQAFTVKATYLTRTVLGESVTERVEKLIFDLPGIVRDRHYGFTESSDVRVKNFYQKGTLIRNNRMWSAISSDEVRRISENLGLTSLDDGLLGVNLVVDGFDSLSSLTQGTYLVFSQNPNFQAGRIEDVVLVVHEQMIPCSYWGKHIGNKLNIPEFKSQFPQAAMPSGKIIRGITGWVEKPGIIEPGYFGYILKPTGQG